MIVSWLGCPYTDRMRISPRFYKNRAIDPDFNGGGSSLPSSTRLSGPHPRAAAHDPF